MADAQSLKKKRKFRNYMCSFVAMNKTGVALEQFTVNGLQVVHDHIKQKLGNLPVCPNECSKHNRVTRRWCVTCTKWRIELETFLAPHLNRLQWHDKKSWCWPNSPQDIAEVFTLPGRHTANINLQDISTIFNVWNRCTQFNRNAIQVLAPLKENRNELIHNPQNMKLTNAKKKLIFQNIKNVINDPDILPLIPNHAELSQLVRDLEQGKLFEDDIVSSLREIGIQNAALQIMLNEHVLESRNTKKTILYMFLACLVTVIAIIVACFYTMQSDNDLKQPWNHSAQNTELQRLTSTHGCLPETTGKDYLGRVSLFEYISHHENFIGRDWLIKIIDTELRQEEYRGILLEAGMGYGKSALMKHIICASEHSLAHRLRRRLLAYHVCRFDVIVSKQAHIFVRRLIDMISSQIPFIAEEINSCKNIFDMNLCERDPNGCLDQCVMIPLKRYSRINNDSFIIAIDAFDECYNKYTDQNEIMDLLKQRLYRFPTGIKFLISTRPNQRGNKHLVKDILSLKLEDESEDNKKDIKRYMQQFNINNSASYFFEIADTNINNFQLLTLLLKNKTESGSTIPVSLERYYDTEFNRIFGTGKNAFEETKQILEVMCTTFQPRTKDNLWYVLSNSSNISFKKFEKALQMLENFFRKIDGEFHIVHSSLQHWLRSPANEDFSVDIENGHKMNAMYLFKLIDDDLFPVNIVDLAIHVDYSADSFLRTMFSDLTLSQVKDLADHSPEYPVLEVAKRADSFIVTDILVSHFTEVEKRNRNNVTALFIAASLGHLKTFEALINRGANVTFRTDSHNDIISFEKASTVSFEHMFWGYGILDIAAQNGHSNIVGYILRNNYQLFDYPLLTLNGMMLLPIHLACKKGHSKVVEQLHAQYNWMLDWRCLYYASENGNIDLVKYILKNGIEDQCRVCKSNLHWIPKGHLRVQGQIVYPASHNYTYVLFDDWNNITCESALHVAVRKNKVDIVKLLVSSRKNTLECYDRGGRIPFFSAVQYGFRDIAEYFVKMGLVTGHETCSTGIHLMDDKNKLHKNEIKNLEEYFCENKMAVAHVVAKYDLKWVVEMLHLYDVEIYWNATDSNGCFPLHVASCHGSLVVLNTILEKNNQNFTTYKCLNGSNPLHSAAACGSVRATKFLLKRYVNYNSESKMVKMSFIKHAIMNENNALLDRDIAKLEEITTSIISMLVTEESDLRINDELNRNVLHHAIQKGHFNVLKYLVSHYEKRVEVLLNAVDKSNCTPLYYAIHQLEPHSQYVIPETLWNDVLAAPLDRISAKEYSVLLTLNFLMNKSRPKINQRLLKQLVTSGCLNIIVFLTEYARTFLLEKSLILSVILENDRHGMQLFAYLTTVIKTTNFKENHNINCQKLTNKHHLHLLALNYQKVSRILSLLNLDRFSDILLEVFFPEKWATLMSTCYDGEYFNVLERAVQGGSAHLVRHLLQVGVKTRLQKITLVKMALNGLQYCVEYEYIAVIDTSEAGILQISFIKHDNILREFGSHNFYTYKLSLLTNLIEQFGIDFLIGNVTLERNNLDLLVSELLTYYKHDIAKSDICSPAARRFSVIHNLAFEGLLSGLKLAVKYWGIDILHCTNMDGFTPLYMSTVFHYESVTNYIMNHDMELKAPMEKAETYFYLKLRYRFFFTRDENRHIKCIMAYVKKSHITVYEAIKAYNCARKVAKIINNEDTKDMIRFFKWNLALYIEISTWNKIVKKIFEILIDLNVQNSKRHSHFLRNVLSSFSVSERNGMFKSLVKKNSLIPNKHMRYTHIAEDETRTCNYLSISFRKTILNGPFDHTWKQRKLFQMQQVLAEFDLHKNNCEIMEYILPQKPVLSHMISTFRLLRSELVKKATKESVYLHLAQQKDGILEIIKNPGPWFRPYHHYNYMDEIQTSTSYITTIFYRSKDFKLITSYFDGIKSAFTFMSWSSNAAKILESYLK